MEIAVRMSVVEKGKDAPEWSLDGDQDGRMTMAEILKHLQNSLITIASTALKEEQAKGFDKNPLILVDNSPTKPVTAVSPFGSIQMVSRVDVALKAVEMYDEILKRSPVASSQYISSHIVLLNGRLIARDRAELDAWQNSGAKLQEKDILYFINLMPYAGFLEREAITAKNRGLHGKVRMVKSTDKRLRAADSSGKVRAPNGAYFLSHREFKRKYKGLGVYFDFTQLSSFGIVPPTSGHVNGKKLRSTFAKSNKKYKGPYVYPMIKIYVKPGSAL